MCSLIFRWERYEQVYRLRVKIQVMIVGWGDLIQSLNELEPQLFF